MHVISRKKLVEFWLRHPPSVSVLRVWFRRVRLSKWGSFAELRADFPSADQVGRRIVFNVGGNKLRLIAAVHFDRGKVYICHVLTHAEYDQTGLEGRLTVTTKAKPKRAANSKVPTAAY